MQVFNQHVMFMSTPWKWNIKIWQFFFSSFLAIETFQNNFILEFYLNLILLFDGMLPVLKKANSLLEMRRDIKLFSFSFFNPLFYVFSAGNQVTNQIFLCKFLLKMEKQFGLRLLQRVFLKNNNNNSPKKTRFLD